MIFHTEIQFTCHLLFQITKNYIKINIFLNKNVNFSKSVQKRIFCELKKHGSLKNRQTAKL